MTKEQLVAKLEEQSHLAEAVRVKDSEIAELKKVIKELEHDYAQNLAKIKEQKQEESEIQHSSEIERLQKVIVEYQEVNKKLVAQANRHVNTFRNLVNVMNGALNMAMDLDEILTPKKEK